MKPRSPIRTAVALALVVPAAAACTSPQQAEIKVAGTLLQDRDWWFQLDEDSIVRFDSGEARVDVGWRTSVRCTDGSRIRQRDLQAGWSIKVEASGFRGEHVPTLVADRVRVDCHDKADAAREPRQAPTDRQESEDPTP